MSLYKVLPSLFTMLRITSLLFLSPLLAGAFVAKNRSPVGRNAALLHMSTEVEDINLVLNGNNIHLTDAISDYVEKRIGGPLRKLGGGGIVRECDVHLSVYKNPKVSLFSIYLCFDSSWFDKVTSNMCHKRGGFHETIDF